MKKLNNKGFTLIEIVIVIVIIAILAAMLVPSLTSWIDNSKKKSFIEGANSCKTAVLSQLSTNYAEKDEFTIGDSDKAAVQKLAGDGVTINEISTTIASEKKANLAAKTFNIGVTLDNDKHTISKMSVQGKDYVAIWNGTAWTVE